MKTAKLKLKVKIASLITLAAHFILLAPSSVSAGTSTPCKNTGSTAAGIKRCIDDNKIIDRLNDIINFLTVGVAVIVVIAIIIGGIQYMLAGDNAQAVTNAKQRITNALIALAAFLLIAAFLQWLVPGGVFG